MLFFQPFGISALALLPALILCIIIYAKDKVEKEPVLLLLGLFLAGAVIFVPSMFAERALLALFDRAFSSHMDVGLYGIVKYDSLLYEILHDSLCGFVASALIEELLKWLVLFFATNKNKNFNSFFDGIVYSVYISMGFCVAGNIAAAINSGWDTLINRFLFSLPENLFFGVLSGLFYTLWHTFRNAKQAEKAYAEENGIEIKKPFRSLQWIVLSIAAPLIMHGIYRFAEINRTISSVNWVFYVFTVLLYVFSFIIVFRISKEDSYETTIAQKLISKKYRSDKNGSKTENQI